MQETILLIWWACIITRVFTRERKRQGSQRRRCENRSRGWRDGIASWGPYAKECSKKPVEGAKTRRQTSSRTIRSNKTLLTP